MVSSNEQYCLRWNDFQANVANAFSDIRDEEDFFDVTLISDNQKVKAHKLILSACSPMFRSMLKLSDHPKPMIFLHGIRYCDIKAILNFMYRGEVNINQDDLNTFLAAAEELQVRGLCQSDLAERKEERRHVQPGCIRNRANSGLDVDCPIEKRPRLDNLDGRETFHKSWRSASPSRGQPIHEDLSKEIICGTDTRDRSVDKGGSSRSLSPHRLQQHCLSGNSSISDGERRLQDERSAFVDQSLPQLEGFSSSEVTFHSLGGRDSSDPLSKITVALSPKGWHCPECIHISTTKGNLKSHILSGRHKLFEKSFLCTFCQKNYSTRQSLQVHISTHHRHERDREISADGNFSSRLIGRSHSVGDHFPEQLDDHVNHHRLNHPLSSPSFPVKSEAYTQLKVFPRTPPQDVRRSFDHVDSGESRDESPVVGGHYNAPRTHQEYL